MANYDTLPRDKVLLELEWVYKMCEAYCWLSWRFRNTFREQTRGEEIKAEAAARLHELIDLMPRESSGSGGGSHQGRQHHGGYHGGGHGAGTSVKFAPRVLLSGRPH